MIKYLQLYLRDPGLFHLQKNSENFFWEFPFGKSAFHLSQVPFEGAEGGLAA